MMSRSGNAAFDSAMITAEGVRQQAVNLAGATQAQMNTANITFYRAAVSNGVANGVEVGPFIRALTDLGTGGV